MSNRLDVCLVTKYMQNGEEKPRWSRVGAAFQNPNGSISIKLDGPTVIVPGVNDMVLMIHKPKDDKPKDNVDFP